MVIANAQIGRRSARKPDEHSCHVDDVSRDDRAAVGFAERPCVETRFRRAVENATGAAPRSRRTPPARLVTRSVAPTIRSCMICSPNGPFVSCPASTRRQKSASHPSDSSASERPTASSAARWRAAKSVAGGAGVAVARAARVANRRLTATTRRRGVFVFAPSALASINSATEPRRCRRIGRGYAYPQTRSPSGELDSDSARVKA